MTASPSLYGTFTELMGKVLPQLRGMPSDQWKNNPDYQELFKLTQASQQNRPNPDTEQGKILDQADELERKRNEWTRRSNQTALDYSSGAVDLRGRTVNQNLDAVTANRDNLTGNTLKLQGGSQVEVNRAQTEDDIRKKEAAARYSMLPLDAYIGLAQGQDRNSLEGLRMTNESRERLQQNAIAAAERQAAERNSFGSIVKDLVRSLPAAAAFII